MSDVQVLALGALGRRVSQVLGIPAVLAVPEALHEIPDGMTITVDGDGGTVLVGDLT